MIQSFEPAGIANFRDFGGFAVAGAKFIGKGRLFRSASPAAATPADVAALAAIPVRAVVDLRRKAERLGAPSPLAGLSEVRVLHNDEGDRAVSQHFDFFRAGDLSASAVEAYLLGYYERLPFEPRHRSLFSSAFDAIESTDGALLIHCTGGKDRTGFLAALIRTALGGAWDDTVDDFTLSNEAGLTPDRLAQAEANLAAVLGRPPGDAALRAYLGVWPHHLEAAFRSAAGRCGSIERYLDLLGVDAARRARLATRLRA